MKFASRGFRKTFFPNPGYVAEDVEFTRGGAGTRPIVRVGTIICRATWIALITFTHRIRHLDLEGLEVEIPPQVPPAVRKHPQAKIKTTVTELVANGAILDIAPRHGGSKGIRFEFPTLVVGNLARNKAIRVRAEIRNPSPPGVIKLSGSVGPLLLARVAETQISGVFDLVDADLGAYKVIAGDLSANGRFEGTLGRAKVWGGAEIPNFEVTSSGHALGLTTEYNALVNGTSGDVVLESAQAHFLSTTLTAEGSISGMGSKTVSVDFDSPKARVEDLLRLFVTAERSPMEGSIAFRAHVVLPATHQPFIRRVRLDGGFAISDAEFTNPQTQNKADELSARALGRKKEIAKTDDAPRTAEEFRGVVKLRDSVATLSTAMFAVPGAVARGGGTYDLVSEAIDLRGELAMRASLSKAAAGFKSILLLPLDPFFGKDGAGSVVPVRISGTYAHPVFKILFTHSK